MISTENLFTFDSLVEELRSAISHFPDKRTGTSHWYEIQKNLFNEVIRAFIQNDLGTCMK